jgi:short chain dehydrogenase
VERLGQRFVGDRGGIILVGAMGAENGVPCMANDGAAKAYVHSLGEALHYEFKPLGVYVTVLAAGFTNTAVLEKFGLDPKTMPMKPMSVEQCVSEGLSGPVCLITGAPTAWANSRPSSLRRKGTRQFSAYCLRFAARPSPALRIAN